MKHTLKILTLLLAAVVSMTACDPEKNNNGDGDALVYLVAGSAAPASPVTARYSTDAERDALLDRLCDYAEEGKAVTFYGAPASRRQGSARTKEATTITTTSREELKAWMAQMEDDGRTVTVTYNSATGTWSGRAYTRPPQPVAEEGPRVSRVTFDYSYDSTGIMGQEEHVVYTYTWDGERLTMVETMEQWWTRFADGSTGDTSVNHGYIQCAYNGDQRVSAGNIRYAYLGGLLVQEWHGYGGRNVSYTYIYDDEGHIVDYVITDTVTRDWGWEEEVTMPGYHIEWENGDAVRAYGDDRETPMWTYEYDESLRPRGVTLGITTLLPGFAYIFEPLTQWSRHNITLMHFNGNDNSWIDQTVTYTYDSAGRPISATLPHGLDGGYGHWTFEYLDE
ncbi:MAG: hypothetical protein IJ634_02990 [Bacteroidales bacterium]|nr:hypothetical protein [Bacteroidales bacterium]